MLTEILLSLCALFFFYLSYRYAVGRPEGFPPGPPRIPFFGSYLFMMMANFKYLHKGVLRLARYYNSDIIGFHMGAFPVVAVHNAEGVREVLNNSDFDGRPQVMLASMRDPDDVVRGIFFQEGELWKDQRRFMLRHLRDYGFGRRFAELELIMQEEIDSLLELIRKGPMYEHEKKIVDTTGYRIHLPYALGTCVTNSFFYIMMNDRVARGKDQAALLRLVEMGIQLQRNGDDYGKLFGIMPWIRHIFPNWSSYNQLMEANRYMYNYFAEIVDRHMITYVPGEVHSFMDLYIAEIQKANEQGKPAESTFHRKHFIMNLLDFQIPPLTTVTSQLSFLVQYLLHQPEVQQRMQQEVDEVVGASRPPTLDDRQHMPYTEATIRECMRIETIVPSDVPHKATVDTQLLGYRIPKDTIMIPSLSAYHDDERIWGDPENFRPDRFLDEAGRLSLKKDVSLPFGAGKRLCPGETFGRNIMFLMLATLMQNFTFVLAPGDKLPDMSKNFSGIIITPQDFWVQLEERIHI